VTQILSERLHLIEGGMVGTTASLDAETSTVHAGRPNTNSSGRTAAQPTNTCRPMTNIGRPHSVPSGPSRQPASTQPLAWLTC
jgi:hypothetical protein